MTDTTDCLPDVTYDEYEHLIERMRIAHPDLAPIEVRQIVDAAARKLAGARLRQFVPLLVERAARDACRRRGSVTRRVVKLPV